MHPWREREREKEGGEKGRERKRGGMKGQKARGKERKIARGKRESLFARLYFCEMCVLVALLQRLFLAIFVFALLRFAAENEKPRKLVGF